MFNQKIADMLHEELKEWCKVNNLPLVSADEILSEEITDDQRTYLLDFIERWETTVYN